MSLRGQLLVAGPTLVDPNFHRTVILVCSHDEDGALGIVLNRQAPMTVGDSVPQLAELLGGGEPLWLGGPVQPEAIVLLADFEEPGEGALMVDNSVGIVLEGANLDELSSRTRRTRAFLGYAGWGPGQLDSELERDDWIVAPASGDDAFSEDPDGLWSSGLERLGGRYALVARMPVDPSLN